MSKDTVHTGPHRRFVFTTDGGVRIEQEKRQEVGTAWKKVAFLNEDELRQLQAELDKRGLP